MDEDKLLKVIDVTHKLLDRDERALREAHWLIEYARCQGEYGLGQEWMARYEAWKKEVGL